MNKIARIFPRQRPNWLRVGGALSSGHRRGSAQRRERKRNTWKLWPLAAGMLFALGLDQFAAGGRSIAAIAQAVSDPLSLLAQRSPGERTPGAKFASKPERAATSMPKAVAAPSPSEAPQAYLAMPVIEPPLPDFPPFVPAGAIPPLGPSFLPASFGGGIPPWFGGTGVPPFGPPLIPPTPASEPPPPSPVPEPASWAMMILGFGIIGGALRRRSGIIAWEKR